MQSKSPHCTFSNLVGHHLFLQTLCVTTLIFLTEYLRTRHIIMPPASAHTFPCNQDEPTHTTGKYTYRYMIYHISFKTQTIFSGILCPPEPSVCLQLHVPLTVMQLICGQRLQISLQKPNQPWQTLYLTQKVLFSFLTGIIFCILSFTIKFQISSTAPEEKRLSSTFSHGKNPLEQSNYCVIGRNYQVHHVPSDLLVLGPSALMWCCVCSVYVCIL